ncbi:MAG: ATP-dependent DNA helicase PcrA [Nitrospira sp.]|nr:ATP-dependent DNA helicase PcrA [Nitrospira sp.]
MVTKLHTKGREIAPHANKAGDLMEIAIRFDCEPDEQWENSGFPLSEVERYALEAMEHASLVKTGATIDGSDMIFLPVRNGWLTPMYDLVVVDECQDMNTAQLEISRGVLKVGGRICLVGDDRQAIFGFRGADSDSLSRLKRELSAGELHLNTTYRCAKSIVEVAKQTVPDFVAGENNPDGLVRSIPPGDLTISAGPGDFILSRLNAPLVSIAMRLLRAGKRTRIAGRDIGKGLINLVRRMKGRSVPDFLSKVAAWETKELARLQKMYEVATNGRKRAVEDKMADIKDQAEMLVSLADGARNVDEIVSRIETLFEDDGLGESGMITCSSIHRSKGLEANRVFILENTLRDNDLEEQNLRYVAVTRAKNELVWVGESREF